MPRDAERALRIRFQHTRYPHWGGRSGYLQFVPMLDPHHHRCTLHGVADSDDDWPRAFDPFKPWLRRRLQRGSMPWYKLSDLYAEWRLWWLCMGRRLDIIHFLDGEHSPRFLPRLLPVGVSSVRLIVTFHQPPEILSDLVDPEVLRRLDQVVVVAPSQLEVLRPFVAAERLQVLLHGVDTDFFHPRHAPRQDGRVRCITAGHWLRDWTAFYQAARRLPDLEFHVVTGQTTGAESLPNVRFHHGIGDQALADLYRESDILFLPLLQATANNALLEGMASGLPVVTTDLDAVRAYIPPCDAILVAPGQPQGYVEALAALAADQERRALLGAAARARAEQLAWRNIIGDYSALYQAVASRPPVKRGL